MTVPQRREAARIEAAMEIAVEGRKWGWSDRRLAINMLAAADEADRPVAEKLAAALHRAYSRCSYRFSSNEIAGFQNLLAEFSAAPSPTENEADDGH